MKILGIEDLPDGFRVSLEKDFRKNVFQLAREKCGGIEKLCKEFDCTRSNVFIMQNGGTKNKRMFIDMRRLRKLSKLSRVPIYEFEKNVEGMKSRKNILRLELPIESNPNLASLIAHFMGDGHLNGRHSSYFNQSMELIRDVKSSSNAIFGIDMSENECKGGYELYFPTGAAKILALVGGVEGSKVSTKMEIPDWIIKGDEEIRRKFLQSFFDDEGSVITNYPRRYIVFNLSKSKELIENNKKFLESLKNMLAEFGIETTKISDWAKNKSGTIEHAFLISRFKSILRYSKEIGFKSKEKNQKLASLIASYKQFKGVK